MPRSRSSSLPSASTPAKPGVPQASVHCCDGPVLQYINSGMSADPDALIPLLLNSIELSTEIGPILQRDTSSGSTVPSLNEIPSKPPDEDTSWLDGKSAETKDTVRRYYALKELLATEKGYLEDLRFLVTVYFRSLPNLAIRSPCSTSTFASFTTGPSSSWMHPSTSHALFTGQSTETQIPAHYYASPHLKAPSSRFLFADHEVELLTRNGEEILHFHEHFFKELWTVLEPLGFSCQSDESHAPHVENPVQLANIDEAIKIVSTKFLTEASRFDIYQTFCAGHPEAMDVLRKAIHRFPAELDIFEHRSSLIVSEMLESKNKPVVHEASFFTEKLSHDTVDYDLESISAGAMRPFTLEDRKRTLSLTFLDDKKDSKLRASPPKSLRLRASMSAMTAIASRNKEKEDPLAQTLDDGTLSELQKLATRHTSISGTTKVKEGDKSSLLTRKIAMADYMIKPVQRICKYPLLLDQLLPSKSLRDVSDDVTVVNAGQAMRRVAFSVDAARERQSVAIQSSLILSRICLGLQGQGVLSSGSFNPPHSVHSGSPSQPNSSSSGGFSTQSSFQTRFLSPTFLSSLGPCLLSGPLDVIQGSYPANTWTTGTRLKVKMKAKYLGVFLYDGGYLIFVKVGKGKRYEPKHWFALNGWSTVSLDNEETMLPHSFRLSKAGQHFELAASCARERDIWLASIAESVKHDPTWIGEPIPSFTFEGAFTIESAPPSAPASDDGHSEPVDIVEEDLPPSRDSVGGLPTISSIPDVSVQMNGPTLESGPRRTRTEPFLASLREHVHGKSGKKKRSSAVSEDGYKRYPYQLEDESHSRRSSSSISVMSVFPPIHTATLEREKEKDREKETETILLTRSSATARQAIDFGLQDVISATCASARADALWKDRVDIGPGTLRPSKTKAGSHMAMGSMTKGMAILSKHESVRVPMKRASVTADTLSRPASSSISTKGTSRRRNVKKLSLASFSFNEYDKSTTNLRVVSTPTTASPISNLQPVTPNISVTPISTTFISVPSDNPSQKVSRSFVQNVKDLFHFRAAIASPVSVIVSHPTQNSLQSVAYGEVFQQENKVVASNNNAMYTAHGLLKRFTKSSGRLRAEGDEVDFVTITSIHDGDGDVAKDRFSVAVPVVASPGMLV